MRTKSIVLMLIICNFLLISCVSDFQRLVTDADSIVLDWIAIRTA